MPDFNNASELAESQHMGQYGDGAIYAGRFAVPAAALNDNYRVVLIPAGARVSGIIIANDDLDSNGTPLAACSLGFVPRSAAEGALAQNLTYFAPAGQTILRAPNLGTIFANFAPIKFEQDVWLNVNITAAAATFAAGSIGGIVLGKNVGVR